MERFIYWVGGSLRQGSFNEMLLQTSIVLKEALTVCPKEGEIEIFDKIGDFPLFSQDLESALPAAIMSAAPGMLGGVKAQYALRQRCGGLNLPLLNKPEVIIPKISRVL